MVDEIKKAFIKPGIQYRRQVFGTDFQFPAKECQGDIGIKMWLFRLHELQEPVYKNFFIAGKFDGWFFRVNSFFQIKDYIC